LSKICWGACTDNHTTFVYTEVFGCGNIGEKFVESYLRSGVDIEKYPLHVFGYSSDLREISPSKGVVLVTPAAFRRKRMRVINSHSIKYAYKRGHAGTALFWLLIILTTKQDKIIHIDSDTILLRDLVSKIDSELDSGFNLVGPRRPYLSNTQKVEFKENSIDLVQTCIFGFRKSKINRKRKILHLYRMILGTYNPSGEKTLDFFDPVSLEILNSKQLPKYLEFDQVGGLNEFGSRENKYEGLNNFPTLRKIDVGSAFIHFSAVGTGVNVYKNPDNNIPLEYADYALDRYALYSQIFFNDSLGRDLSQYKNLIVGLQNHLKEQGFY
jgi:hypothetical protein